LALLSARFPSPFIDNPEAGHRFTSHPGPAFRLIPEETAERPGSAVRERGATPISTPTIDFGRMTEPFGQKIIDSGETQSMLTERFGQ
jgi:hypothetical protein